MFNITRKEIDWGGRKLVLETGRMARQADGAVLATYGETAVLCVATAAKEPNPNVDFFPLTVNYIERAYAAGKIPGGFFKREGRPSEKETLVSRLIDRPIRPLFHEDFRNETQVVCTVLSHDMENDPDIVAMIGASAALTLSGIPFLGPIGAARVGYRDGRYILNPTADELESSALDLVVAGTHDAVLMVESEAKELSEDEMLGAVLFGHEQMQPVIRMIIELAEEAAKDPWEVPERPDLSALDARIRALAEQPLREAYGIIVKQERRQRVDAIKQEVKAQLAEEVDEERAPYVDVLLKALEKEIVRGQILETGRRIDGRGLADVRPVDAEVAVLPRAHGSALFTRGETQALCVATLGTGEDEQIIDALIGSFREHFLLHYNFPP
ncbi:MAG: polyribonucleotide nucleotidyltransferase, partial [Alphaproteobacteria bacterium]